MSARPTGAIAATRTDTGNASFLKFTSLPPGDVLAVDVVYPTNVCSIDGFPGPDGMNTRNGAPVTIIPTTSVNLDAGPAITIKGPAGTRTISRTIVGGHAIYMAPQFGNGTAGDYFDPGHYTATGTGGPDVGPINTAVDVLTTPFVWTNMPDPTKPIDRTKDLTVTWTGGYPDTQVTIEGGSLANGVNVSFLCAAPVSAGRMTVPAYVLENLPPTGSAGQGQLTMLNRIVTTFTATGLDLASIHYAVTYTVNLKYQ